MLHIELNIILKEKEEIKIKATLPTCLSIAKSLNEPVLGFTVNGYCAFKDVEYYKDILTELNKKLVEK